MADRAMPLTDLAAEILVTDAHWRAITKIHNYSGFTSEEFREVWSVLTDAKNVLGNRDSDDLALPELLAMSCWDIGIGEFNDLLLTVDLPGGPKLATEPIKLTGPDRVLPAKVSGSHAARAILNVLVSCRNRLLRELEEFAAAAGQAAHDHALDDNLMVTEGVEKLGNCGCGDPIALWEGEWFHVYNDQLRGTDDHDPHPG